MNTESIANRLVSLCRAGKFNEAQDELFAANARSIEMEGMTGDLGTVQGLDAIHEKGRRFDATISEVHFIKCSDPLIADSFFTVRMDLDATYKQGGRRAMSELCVYEVADGKIVREQFFYATN
ncbi:nuclear transport factor 2 family protein [Povalibacter sp.]|uniref:nuclear transport factor 2 family protein n=1 Tax=Povalibacter sp. TaxID=1962978 RepID=UPI002F4003F8